jgi:cyclopropane-fatty-acyl-phospholipid synthase
MDPFSDIRAGLSLLQGLLPDGGTRNVAVRFWDGSTWKLCSEEKPVSTLVLRHEDSLRRMLRFPLHLSLAESYIYDDVDIEGSIEAVVPLADDLMRRRWTVREWFHFAKASWTERGLERLPEEIRSLALQGRRHEKLRDKQAVRFHYDLPVEFYRLWLDPHLMYSCASYQHHTEELSVAQARKLDYVCRKLQLQPNDHVLDIGCGWGGFALYAAKEYGAVVHGITLSRRQAEVANQRVVESGLSRRCRIEVRDYRDVQGEELYDKILSVGMIEHVGRAQLAGFVERAERLLRPGGGFLVQGIGASDGRSSLGAFADRYVFPDAEWAPLHEVVRAAQSRGFDVRDVENMREQYALTVDAWRSRLEHRHREASQLVGEVTYRIWRLSLAAAAYLFRAGRLAVYETLCVKAASRPAWPVLRDDWYESPRDAAMGARRAA